MRRKRIASFIISALAGIIIGITANCGGGTGCSCQQVKETIEAADEITDWLNWKVNHSKGLDV